MKDLLDENKKDCLQELINISYGRATASIAELLDAFATMHIPYIEILSNRELVDKLQHCCDIKSTCYLTIQLFKGKFDGETILLIDDESANNLLAHLKESVDSTSKQDVVCELSNIITSSLVAELSKLLGTDVYFNEPSFVRLDSEIIEIGIKDRFECAILINTLMEFKEQHIEAEVMILTHQKSFEWLSGALDKIIEELY